MAKKPTVQPGGKVPDSGIYKSTKSGHKATMVRGEPAPPTPQRGEKWRQVIDTNPGKPGGSPPITKGRSKK